MMKGSTDGIPSGAIRSDYTTMKVDAKRWCSVFGHKIRQYGDGRFCRECEKSESEIIKEQNSGEKV